MMLRERPGYQRRIKRIKAALRRQGQSQTWAAMRIGHTPGHVCQVLRLQCTSLPLVVKLEALLEGET